MPALPTLRQLEYAVAVAEHKSFARAARALSREPARSQRTAPPTRRAARRASVRARSRSVWITAAGEELVQRARSALDGVHGMVEVAHAFKHPLRGVLRVGVIPTIAAYLFPQRAAARAAPPSGTAAAAARRADRGAGRIAAARRSRPAGRRARSAARRARDAAALRGSLRRRAARRRTGSRSAARCARAISPARRSCC